MSRSRVVNTPMDLSGPGIVVPQPGTSFPLNPRAAPGAVDAVGAQKAASKPQLHQRSAGDLVRESFQLYFANFLPIYFVAGLPLTPLLILDNYRLLTARIPSRRFRWLCSSSPTPSALSLPLASRCRYRTFFSATDRAPAGRSGGPSDKPWGPSCSPGCC